jgi:hypothetical protein
MTELEAWHAAKLMGMGINISNTFENTSQWEVGWGNPRITKEYIGSLAALGFKTVLGDGRRHFPPAALLSESGSAPIDAVPPSPISREY